MAVFSATIDDTFHQIYPGASVGIMVIDQASNPKSPLNLTELKTGIETSLRERYSEKSLLRANPTVQAYETYYKQFKKNYVVLAQLESVIFKGRSIPNTNALVQAMFMAELDNMLLTAGHDLGAVEQPVSIGLGKENMNYTLMNGNEQSLKTNDMLMRDQKGIISSVIYGPDKRTRISSSTQDAMYVTYTPEGVSHSQIEKHFDDIYSYIQLFAPNAIIADRKIF